MEPARCGICGAAGAFAYRGKKNEYTLWECARCTGQFWDPMRNPGPGWYKHDERYSFRNRFPLRRPESNHREFLRDMPAHGGRLLDIGMGTGNFLASAVRAGYEGYGIDFDEDAVRAAEAVFGLKNVFSLDIDGALKKFGEGRFDAITMFEVLEHLEHPAAFIEKTKRLLKPGGFLAMSMPYRGSWDAFKKYDYPPRHLTRWDRASLASFLVREGFVIRRTRVIPASFRYLVTKFHFWTEGFLSFRMVEKVAKRGGKERGDRRRERLLVRALGILAKTKDYVLFSIPAAFLLAYLFVRRRRGLTLYVLARRANI